MLKSKFLSLDFHHPSVLSGKLAMKWMSDISRLAGKFSGCPIGLGDHRIGMTEKTTALHKEWETITGVKRPQYQ